MAKGQRHIRGHQSNEVTNFEHKEVFDDNLLPDSSEIEKLHAIDNNILPWLKLKADKEQDFRHEAYNKRLEYTISKNCRDHNTVRMGLIIYFVLVIVCVIASYLLLRDGKNIQGSIFGGVTLILALAVLITRKPSGNSDESNK